MSEEAGFYRLSTRFISRGKGHDIGEYASYCSGETVEIVDDDGHERKHTWKRDDVRESWRERPHDSPDYFDDQSRLWSSIDQREKRRDSRLARETIVSLPHELNRDEQKRLVSGYARHLTDHYGVVVDVSIHQPDDRNSHAHILSTLRRWDSREQKWGDRDQDLVSKRHLYELRESWESHVNSAYKSAGIPKTVSCRGGKGHTKEANAERRRERR